MTVGFARGHFQSGTSELTNKIQSARSRYRFLSDDENTMTDTQEQQVQDNQTTTPANDDQQKVTVTEQEKMIPQSEVNRIMAREKSQGRSAALRALGLNPDDEKSLTEVKDWVESKKPENQKQAEAILAQQKAIADAERKAFIAETKAELLTSGVQTQYTEDALALIQAKGNSEGFDVKKEIENLKTKYPVWFTKEPEQGQSGTGNPIQAGQVKVGVGTDYGTRLGKARAESEKAPQKSYWS